MRSSHSNTVNTMFSASSSMPSNASSAASSAAALVAADAPAQHAHAPATSAAASHRAKRRMADHTVANHDANDVATHTDEQIIKTILINSSIAQFIEEKASLYVSTNAQNNKCNALLAKLRAPELPPFIGLPNYKKLFSDTEEKQYQGIMTPLLKDFEAKLKHALVQCKEQTAAATKDTLKQFEVTVAAEATQRLNALMQDETTTDFVNTHRLNIVQRIVQLIKQKSTKRIVEQASKHEKRLLVRQRHEEKMDVAEAEVHANPAKTFRDIAQQVVTQMLNKHHHKHERAHSGKSSRASSTKSNTSTRAKSHKRRPTSSSKKRQVAFKTKKAGNNKSNGPRGRASGHGSRERSRKKNTGREH